jgi:hypothetical protein
VSRESNRAKKNPGHRKTGVLRFASTGTGAAVHGEEVRLIWLMRGEEQEKAYYPYY